MLALRLPKELEERLEFMAKKTGRTKSSFARQAIIDNIDELIYCSKRLSKMTGPELA
jgi:RHH-type transcriptional regulator, rel operon repressor / antitoxin RelB